MTKHTAAIHVLKNRLRMSDDDYRALLRHLTGKDSSRDMSDAERGRVRTHLQNLSLRMGLESARADERPRYRDTASPLERKVWALWNAAGREGKLDNPSAAGLQAWVRRQVGVDHIRFCTDAQLHTLIESLKLWQGRSAA